MKHVDLLYVDEHYVAFALQWLRNAFLGELRYVVINNYSQRTNVVLLSLEKLVHDVGKSSVKISRPVYRN